MKEEEILFLQAQPVWLVVACFADEVDFEACFAEGDEGVQRFGLVSIQYTLIALLQLGSTNDEDSGLFAIGIEWCVGGRDSNESSARRCHNDSMKTLLRIS